MPLGTPVYPRLAPRGPDYAAQADPQYPCQRFIQGLTAVRHDSGPQRLVEPSTYDSFTHNILPVRPAHQNSGWAQPIEPRLRICNRPGELS